jgi:hypothetical protein
MTTVSQQSWILAELCIFVQISGMIMGIAAVRQNALGKNVNPLNFPLSVAENNMDANFTCWDLIKIGFYALWLGITWPFRKLWAHIKEKGPKPPLD